MNNISTKILFLDNDLISFQICQCIASVLESLPDIEMIYAADAEQALRLMEQTSPHVIVVNYENNANQEREIFLQNLPEQHPPVIVQAEEADDNEKKNEGVIYLSPSGSIGEMHHILHVATAAAMKAPNAGELTSYH